MGPFDVTRPRIGSFLCQRRAGRRSQPRSRPTSASRSRSSPASPSPARRPCSPRPSTRSPTPATRPSSSSAAGAPGDAPRPSIPSGSARSATSGPSSSPSCCSRSAGCSRSSRGSTSSCTPTTLESFPIALAVLGVAIVLEALSFRTAMKQASPGARRRVVVAVHQALEEPRAPCGAPRGHRRTARALPRRGGRDRRRDHRQLTVGRARQHRHRAPPRRHRDRARDRDEEPAHRRVRRPATWRTRSPRP